jgi:oxygen-dependent protoporphyrinogen oxidase
MTDFTVIGGGIAGLVVARRLALLGNGVDLIEASDRLGGAVAHHRVGGIDLDAAAATFSTRGGHVAALAVELGLAEDIEYPISLGRWLHPAEGAAVPLPHGSVLGIPGTPLAADVIAAVGNPAAIRAQLDAVIPSLRSRQGETLGHLVRRRMGRTLTDRLVAPIVRADTGVDVHALPVEHVAGLRAAMEREGSLAAAVRFMLDGAPALPRAGIRGGVNRLVTELVADLRSLEVGIQLGRRVDSIEEFGDRVIVAAPLGGEVGRDVVLVTLVVDSPELDAAPRGTGVVVAHGAPGIRARALTHVTAEWGWVRERAAGRHVIVLSYDQAPPEAAVTAAADAEELLGVRFEAVVDVAEARWTIPPARRPEAGLAGRSIVGTDLAAVVQQAEEVALAAVNSA